MATPRWIGSRSRPSVTKGSIAVPEQDAEEDDDRRRACEDTPTHRPTTSVAPNANPRPRTTSGGLAPVGGGNLIDHRADGGTSVDQDPT